jgi:hypothetical protein
MFFVCRGKVVTDDDTLKDENEKLKKEIEYYKDLCLWHVEEKEKLKREHYINE